jgi:hypothetical protein
VARQIVNNERRNIMGEIKWEDPASAKRGPGRKPMYDLLVAQLKLRPGVWAVVAENVSPNTVTHLKKMYALEATARGIKGGRAEKIYARWPE